MTFEIIENNGVVPFCRLVSVIHEAFGDWKKDDLNSPSLSISEDDLIQYSQNGKIFVAHDTSSGSVLGVMLFENAVYMNSTGGGTLFTPCRCGKIKGEGSWNCSSCGSYRMVQKQRKGIHSSVYGSPSNKNGSFLLKKWF